MPKREGVIVGNASPTSDGRDDGIPSDTYKTKEVSTNAASLRLGQ